MKEIRIHGRGGQGAVTTGQLIAIAAFYDGKESQTFPNFGVERSGAPVLAYARIDDKKINLRSQVYHPDIVLVMDSSLLDTINISSGIAKNGTIIVNSNKSPKELGLKGDFTVKTIDATTVALKIFKRPIVNTPVLGAFSAATGLVSLKSLYKAIDDIFLKTKGKKIADLNKQAIKEVYDLTK